MTTYWSLQTEYFWERFKNQGFLEGTGEYAMFPKEYQWMMAQMGLRLSNYKGEFPIWLWLIKPDMRSSGHFMSNTSCVRLRIELDEKDVLVSDFVDWHSVLNDSFNADNEVEYDEYYDGKLNITKEDSWNRILELNRNRDPYWCGTQDRWLQGVTGRISVEKVKRTEHFISRRQSKV